MNKLREHILIKFAIVFLVAALVLPSIVKLSHAFANHEHSVCTSDSAHHFHEINLDCEFYKFKKTGESYISQVYIGSEPFLGIQPDIVFYYTFLNSHQQTSITLRGPPHILV